MLAIRGHSVDGKVLILLVMEPGNIEKMKSGQPVHKFLNEFMPELNSKVELVFSYTPDIEWVCKQIGDKPTMESIGLALDASLTREPVVVRDKSAEDMKRII